MEKIFFDQTVKNDLRTCDNRKIATGQGDDYTTGYLLDNVYFKNNKHLMLIQKQCSKLILLWNLDRAGNNVCRYWRSKRNCFEFFRRNCEYIVNLFCFNVILM